MKRIAYISPVFDEKNTYRENVLVEYLKDKYCVDVFTYHRNAQELGGIVRCSGMKIKEFYFYFSTRFVLKKYDYIILSDLRQIAPIIFGLLKIFSNSKIIVEHEQRNFGKSFLGKLMSFILYVPCTLLYLRVDLIRSPNYFSTSYLKNFYFNQSKIKELPLAVSTRFRVSEKIEYRKTAFKILWSGKRFYEKSGVLLIKFISLNRNAILTIVTSDKLSIEHPRIKIIPMQTTIEFKQIIKRHSVCVYMSPTQTIFDTSALGLPTIIPKSFVPLNKHTENKFIFLNCETGGDGVVRVTESNYQVLEKALRNCNAYNLHPYSFEAEHLWAEYE